MQNASRWLDSFRSPLSARGTRNTTKISITGGKGGVGKTSISLKFAKHLASLGHRTLLIDCDYNMSNTAIKLGLPLNNTFMSLLTAEKSFESCLYKDGNFHLLSSCNGDLDLFDAKFNLEEIMMDIISVHESDYDFIILDCPAGLSKETLTLNAYCDQRIMVVTPDKSSITDSYALMKVLAVKYGIKDNSILVNMYSGQAQFQKVVKTLSETVEKFLGTRLSVFGGIEMLETNKSDFDHFFLSDRKIPQLESFLKSIEQLAENSYDALVYQRTNSSGTGRSLNY